jgi:hypothetical protein
MSHYLLKEGSQVSKLSSKKKIQLKSKESQADATGDDSRAQKEVAKCRTRDVQSNGKNASTARVRRPRKGRENSRKVGHDLKLARRELYRDAARCQVSSARFPQIGTPYRF